MLYGPAVSGIVNNTDSILSQQTDEIYLRVRVKNQIRRQTSYKMSKEISHFQELKRQLRKDFVYAMSKILIIDDDVMMCERFTILIDSLGHASDCAHTLEQGLEKAVAENFDIVLLDVYLPDGYGIDAVAKVREMPSKPEVIIVTANGDPDAAEIAIKSGAWDYIEKSPPEKDMLLPLKRALAYREEKSKPQGRSL